MTAYKSIKSILLASTAILFVNTSHAALIGDTPNIIFDNTVNFDTPDELRPTVDAFRDILGPLNANAPVNGDPNGRRQINWDAAPDAISDPNPFPGDFFNGDSAPRARGIEFRETGDTTGFELSATEDSGTAPLFGLPTDFQAFSQERIFRQVGGDTFDVLFFDPSDQTTPALTSGLGVVFTDVELFDTAFMVFYDQFNNILAERNVAPGNDIGLSFLGLAFDAPIISRVSFTVGGGNVAMDDFIFGEPIAIAEVPVPATVSLLLAGIALSFGRKKFQMK
ncbi:PEP-CTERM sorting domain-containing protein [Ningiella sp. W23]|uniref:PEP-CTERM sorting domain-containing protein n=1 Tax=Ningiella sp. W23 TaxID=3023715 RepID=UPI0037566CBB